MGNVTCADRDCDIGEDDSKVWEEIELEGGGGGDCTGDRRLRTLPFWLMLTDVGRELGAG